MNLPKIPQEVAATRARLRLRPVALALAVALASLGVAAAPASADAPAGGCPTSYTLWAISAIPAQGQPGAITLDQRGNNDGYVCLMS